MFGTEIKLPTFLFICLELVVFFFQLANYLSRRQDKSRTRFLLLVAAFIFYNLCSGFLPDNRIPLHALIQNIFAFGSGIILATYYFYYLVKELNIAQQRLFNTKILLGSLVASFIIGFICTYIVTSSIQLSKRVFIILPVLISIYFCVLTVRFLLTDTRIKTDKSPYKLMVYSGYIGIIFMATMPIVVFFGDYQIINNSLVNVSFFLAFYAYIKHHLYQSRIEYEILESVGHFGYNQPLQKSLLQFGLTPAELNVAYLILNGKSYTEIGEAMYIVHGTASKHGSNIFKKTGTKNRTAFVKRFGGEIKALKSAEEFVLQYTD